MTTLVLDSAAEPALTRTSVQDQRVAEGNPVSQSTYRPFHNVDSCAMSRTALDFLWSSSPPWIYVGFGEAARTDWTPSHFYSCDELDVCVRRLRGWKMRTVGDLMNEIGAALQLFDGFGENWYALEESLCCMDEWLPADAYVLVVEGAEDVLSGDVEQLRAMLTTFNAAGEFWSRPVDGPERFQRGPAPFHLLLNMSSGHPEAVLSITKAAATAGIKVRAEPIGQ